MTSGAGTKCIEYLSKEKIKTPIMCSEFDLITYV